MSDEWKSQTVSRADIKQLLQDIRTAHTPEAMQAAMARIVQETRQHLHDRRVAIAERADEPLEISSRARESHEARHDPVYDHWEMSPAGLAAERAAIARFEQAMAKKQEHDLGL